MTEETGEPEEIIYKSLLPDKQAEKIRRKKIMPLLINEYLEDIPRNIEYFVEKYHIPAQTIYDIFRKEGVSRKDVRQERKIVTLKEVRAVETQALSSEAEKIATFAIGIGGVIARRYLGFLDYEISHGKTLELIAEEVMQWYETKHSTLAEIDELKVKLTKKDKELSAAWAISLPNFKYWLRTRILERYAAQVINARIVGVRLPISKIVTAMQTDLLKLEGDVNDIFEGENKIGIES